MYTIFVEIMAINKNPWRETKPKPSILLECMLCCTTLGSWSDWDAWMTFPAGEIHLQILVYLQPMNLKTVTGSDLPYMACLFCFCFFKERKEKHCVPVMHCIWWQIHGWGAEPALLGEVWGRSLNRRNTDTAGHVALICKMTWLQFNTCLIYVIKISITTSTEVFSNE